MQINIVLEDEYNVLKRVIKSTIDIIWEKEKHIKSMKPADSFIVVVVVVIYI